MPPVRALIASCEPADGPLNFARDDALLAAARDSGNFAARVYGWSGPTISFGRHERTHGWYSRERIEQARLGVVRRRTGGRALLHYRELTYAIAGPTDASDSVTATYMALGNVLVEALHNLRVPAEISEGTRKENTEGAPCFATTTRGEIVVGGRKLVASAQWRGDGAFLQHGSIMLSDQQAMLERALEPGRTVAFGDSVALDELLASACPGIDELADALCGAFRARAGVAAERVSPGVIVDEDAVRNALVTYEDPDWTWRR